MAFCYYKAIHFFVLPTGHKNGVIKKAEGPDGTVEDDVKMAVIAFISLHMRPVGQPIIIRPLQKHEWAKYRDARLRSLADSPDAFGSTLAEEQTRTPDDWAWRLAGAALSGRDFPLIAESDGAVAGLAWAKADAVSSSVINIYQVWVAPESRGNGVASRLLREAIRWARSRNARVVQLGVTCGDTPARRLYEREGFKPVGEPEPMRPGSLLLEQKMHLHLEVAADSN